MQPDTYAILGFMTLFGAGFAAFFWRQLEDVKRALAHSVTRHEFDRFHQDMTGDIQALRSDIEALRAEMRAAIASLRSDLTQVALALGTREPRASEG